MSVTSCDNWPLPSPTEQAQNIDVITLSFISKNTPILVNDPNQLADCKTFIVNTLFL